MGTVAAVGAVQLAGAALKGIVWVLGWISLAVLVFVLFQICCAAAGNMRLARKRKQNLKGAVEVGDDVIEMLGEWDDAAFDKGLKRLYRENGR